MDADRNKRGAARPSRKLGWIVGGALILLLAIFALQGIVRGSGEATGVSQSAPGDDNANPAGETTDSRQ
jgi:hypothetical protein